MAVFNELNIIPKLHSCDKAATILNSMKRRKTTDVSQYTPLPRSTLYGKVIFWVFFLILTLEVVILLSYYLIFYDPKLSKTEDVVLLVSIGCMISTIAAIGIIWAIEIIIAIHIRKSPIKTEEEFALLSDLSHAMEKSQLKLYFQPQVNLVSGKITGMEALLRWEHPKKGIIMPGDFIPMAEKAGLIEAIGEWTLIQACTHTKKLLDMGYNMRVAVNLSPLQFKQPDIVDDISEILNTTQLPPENLELEITETAMIENIEDAIQTMFRLRNLGVVLAMDDFGTGYSSLSSVDRLPIQKLKIDKAFVHSVTPYDEEPSLAPAIIEMAHRLHLQILVEGVESEYQKKYFRELKCHEAQGYYLGPPVPAEKFQSFLRH